MGGAWVASGSVTARGKQAGSDLDEGVPQSTEQVAVRLPTVLVQEMRSAVYWTPGETITSLVARAVGRELRRLERERGKPFPAAQANVRRGRPVGRR